MRSWNLSRRNARRHKFAWRGPFIITGSPWKGILKTSLSLGRKLLPCVSDDLVRRFVRYSGAWPFRDLKAITHVYMVLNSLRKRKPILFLKHLIGGCHKIRLKYYSGCSLLHFAILTIYSYYRLCTGPITCNHSQKWGVCRSCSTALDLTYQHIWITFLEA